MAKKIARLSIFSKSYGFRDGKYECQCDWPDNGFWQCGDNGIVFTRKPQGSYKTAFFEVFYDEDKSDYDCFIRGEGKTLEEAEESAWKKFKKENACDKHEWERRGYRNGAGFCKHCNKFKSNVFEPLEECIVCKKKCFYSSDKEGNWYCEEHNKQNPDRPELILGLEE